MAEAWLLRAVNLGARNKVPMADLRRIAADLGATGVRTVLNTGNLLTDSAPAGFGPALLERISSELGVTTSLVRVHDGDLRDALSSCPLDPADYSVIYAAFLSAAPSAEAAAALEEADFGPDRAALWTNGSACAVVLGYASTVHGSGLSNARIEKILGVTATSRNLSTLAKLV